MGYRRCAKAEEWQTRRSSSSSDSSSSDSSSSDARSHSGYEDDAAPPGAQHRDDETDPQAKGDVAPRASGGTGHARHRAPSGRAARSNTKNGDNAKNSDNAKTSNNAKGSSVAKTSSSAKSSGTAKNGGAGTAIGARAPGKRRAAAVDAVATRSAGSKRAVGTSNTDATDAKPASAGQLNPTVPNASAPRGADLSENDSFAYDSMPVSLDLRRAHNSARDDRATTGPARNRLAWSELTLGDLALNDLPFTKQNSPARPRRDSEDQVGPLRDANADGTADGEHARPQAADAEMGNEDTAAEAHQPETATSEYASGTADLFDRTFRGAATEAGLKPESLGRHIPTIRRAIGSGQAVLLVMRCSRPDQPNAADHVLVVSRDRLVVTSETRSLHRVKPHLNAATAALLNVRWQIDPGMTSIEFAATVIDGVRERFLISAKDPAAVSHIEAVLGYVFRPAGVRRFNPVDPIMPSWMNPAGAY